MTAPRILLADDEVHITRLVARRLEESGHEIRVACDGEEAWSVIQEWPPNLIITDLQMPYVSGIDLVLRARTQPQTADIPVIMLTARGYVLQEEQIKQAKITHLLSKPFSIRRLATLVEELLEQNEQARRAA